MPPARGLGISTLPATPPIDTYSVVAEMIKVVMFFGLVWSADKLGRYIVQQTLYWVFLVGGYLYALSMAYYMATATGNPNTVIALTVICGLVMLRSMVTERAKRVRAERLSGQR
jgi:uncharacterized membrane protein